MSPIVKSKGERFTLPGKYLLLILSFICILLMVLTYGTHAFDVPVNSVAGAVLVPFEKGISRPESGSGTERMSLHPSDPSLKKMRD